jgi:hypothetical protein
VPVALWTLAGNFTVGPSRLGADPDIPTY